MKIRSTTILTVRHNGRVAMGGDGQVTLGQTVVKSDATKIRKLAEGKVLVGFAGAAADAFALMERLEAKLKDHPANLVRAATELAKDWRMDRALRRLEAMVAVVDAKNTLLVSGTGDVIQPSDGILGIGSGGNYALAAARALMTTVNPTPDEPLDSLSPNPKSKIQNPKSPHLTAADIVRRSLEIAADICVYSNRNIVIEELP
jgi:ATP-dependent HslUV protease subunit HslV